MTSQDNFELSVINLASKSPLERQTYVWGRSGTEKAFMIDLVSGVFGGMAGILSGHPFDTIK